MFNKNISTHPAKTSAHLLEAVYGWMAAGLTLSAISSYITLASPTFFIFIHQNPIVFFGLFFLQIGLVVSLSSMLHKLSFGAAISIFFAYAVSVGITLSSIFLLYTASSIATTFLTTAGMFGFMALYGHYTKSDLSSMGNTLLMLVFGMCISMLLNMFIQNQVFDLVISAVGVVVFTLLTAYDTQRIKLFMEQQSRNDTDDMAYKTTILGALVLYLDFINLFIYLLRFMGKRKE